MDTLAARVITVFSFFCLEATEWRCEVGLVNQLFHTSLSTLLFAGEPEDFCHPGKLMQSGKLNQSSLNELYTQFVRRYAIIDKETTIHTCMHTFIATSDAHFSYHYYDQQL